jgi:hypothetical protein
MHSRRLNGLIVLAFASGICLVPHLAAGQLLRPQLAAAMEAPLSQDVPTFRDPKTGQIFTPYNVGQDGKPLDPSDRAFDPGGQAVVPGPPIEIAPRISSVGKVPITAGPTVPLIEIDNLSIHTSPSGHWHVVFFLQNNSDSTLAAEVACTFQNGEKAVARAVVYVPPAAPGDRLAVFFTGPSTTVFLDKMTCQVTSS